MKYFPHVVTSLLLVLAGVLHSFPFAYAAVFALVVTLAKEGFEHYLEVKSVKASVPEEAKRKLHDLEVRITSMEFGIKQSGFFPQMK